MIHNQHDMQQQHWRQDYSLPKAGADFPEEDDEDDELPGSGPSHGDENPSYRETQQRRNVSRGDNSATPLWAVRWRLSVWHKS